MSSEVVRVVKVHVELPNQYTGEAMWAFPLGEDLYRLDNIPIVAYGLNYRDVVHAVAPGPGLAPEIHCVVQPAGHRTVRVLFRQHLSKRVRSRLMKSLARRGLGTTLGPIPLAAVDVPPEFDLDTVVMKLQGWVEDGWAEWWETCEARVEGSFDAPPEEWVH